MKCLSKTKFGADRKWLLHILNMIILPKLAYGAPIYFGADPKTALKLNPVYHQGIRYATGAFHSSPIESILSESGQLPLKLILAKQTAIYACRQLSRGILNSDLHVINKTREILNELHVPDTTTEEENPTAELRWDKRNYRINTEFPDRSTPTEKQAHFKELCNGEYRLHHHIYTDGSKMEQGVGCGIYSHNSSNTSICLPKLLSIFSAEAYAILKAVEASNPNKLTVIFSDSKSVLDAIDNNNSNHPWISSIRKTLEEKQGKVELCWIPAHVNISGNEKADELAKNGALLQNPIDIKIPFEDLKRAINSSIIQNWQNTWQTNNSKLRQIKNTTKEWNTSYNNDRFIDRIITRLRIGHTKLTHQHYAKKEDPASCSTCGVPITVQHILIDCRRYEKERKNNLLGSSLHELIGDDAESLKKTIKFLKDSNLIKLL